MPRPAAASPEAGRWHVGTHRWIPEMLRTTPTAFLLLALAFPCAHAQQGPEEIIKRRGFDFQPREETPWGVKLDAPQRLAWVEANGTRYKIDTGAAIPLHEERSFIQGYLRRHAAQEVGLLAELFFGEPPSVEVSLGSPSITSFSTVLDEPPVSQYRAEFRAAKVGQRARKVDCRFMFIAHAGSTFLVYAKMPGYTDRGRSVEPHCDLQ